MASTTTAPTDIPAVTRDQIVKFDTIIARAYRTVEDGKRNALMREVYRLGADLKNHANDLDSRLEKGEAWLNAHATVGEDGNLNSSDHPQWAAREAQWLAWLKEYTAVMDALERGKAVL